MPGNCARQASKYPIVRLSVGSQVHTQCIEHENARASTYQQVPQGLGSAVQIHAAEMAKQPLWTAKRSRARIGYMLANDDGQYAIKTADHTFPLTERFLVSTSGVVKCAAPPKTDRPKGHQDEPELAKTFRPSAMQAFIRINLSWLVQLAVLVIRQID